MAPGPERGHHVCDDDVQCLIPAGIHEEACGTERGPQGLSDHSFITVPAPQLHGWTGGKD